VVAAIAHIHELLILHRDLKPSNVLLDSNCAVKICDFGLVRKLDSQQPDNQILSEEVATKWYRAPELLLGSRSYGFPVDLWSVGCIAAELLTGKTLFSGMAFAMKEARPSSSSRRSSSFRGM
jgi:serine/threonine protein kinase